MKIFYTRAAENDLAQLTKADARAIVEGCERFAETSHGDVKKLQGVKPPAWRLRLGRFRVTFIRNGPDITVVSVKDRKDAYR